MNLRNLIKKSLDFSMLYPHPEKAAMVNMMETSLAESMVQNTGNLYDPMVRIFIDIFHNDFFLFIQNLHLFLFWDLILCCDEKLSM